MGPQDQFREQEGRGTRKSEDKEGGGGKDSVWSSPKRHKPWTEEEEEVFTKREEGLKEEGRKEGIYLFLALRLVCWLPEWMRQKKEKPPSSFSNRPNAPSSLFSSALRGTEAL